jgi:two-component system, cell cycle sensor histidine kinase and response regulator CckA
MSSHDETTPRRLLIADDAPPVLSWVRRAFSRAGWEVLTAKDGGTAWDLWQQARETGRLPHLLMTDLNMPGLHGGALIELVRSVSPQIPILVLTGLEADEMVWNKNVPARTLLVRKPVATSDLIAAATELVDGAHTSDFTRPAA